MKFGPPSAAELERFQKGLAGAMAALGAPGTAEDAAALQERYLADIERGFGGSLVRQPSLPLHKVA